MMETGKTGEGEAAGWPGGSISTRTQRENGWGTARCGPSARPWGKIGSRFIPAFAWRALRWGICPRRTGYGALICAAMPLAQYGQSEFLQAAGKSPDALWPILDELMDTIQTVSPRVYNSVMRKIMEG